MESTSNPALVTREFPDTSGASLAVGTCLSAGGGAFFLQTERHSYACTSRRSLIGKRPILHSSSPFNLSRFDEPTPPGVTMTESHTRCASRGFILIFGESSPVM